jgi:hypothetical protein
VVVVLDWLDELDPVVGGGVVDVVVPGTEGVVVTVTVVVGATLDGAAGLLPD